MWPLYLPNISLTHSHPFTHWPHPAATCHVNSISSAQLIGLFRGQLGWWVRLSWSCNLIIVSCFERRATVDALIKREGERERERERGKALIRGTTHSQQPGREKLVLSHMGQFVQGGGGVEGTGCVIIYKLYPFPVFCVHVAPGDTRCMGLRAHSLQGTGRERGRWVGRWVSLSLFFFLSLSLSFSHKQQQQQQDVEEQQQQKCTHNFPIIDYTLSTMPPPPRPRPSSQEWCSI